MGLVFLKKRLTGADWRWRRTGNREPVVPKTESRWHYSGGKILKGSMQVGGRGERHRRKLPIQGDDPVKRERLDANTKSLIGGLVPGGRKENSAKRATTRVLEGGKA